MYLSVLEKNLHSDQEIAGAIQAFEFTFEQIWKILKKVLQKKGISCGSPRDTFRGAAQDGLIKSPEIWFLYLDKRNLTSYTYNQDIALKILPKTPKNS